MNDPLFPASASARADAEQREASDPRVSAFVSASAGSGKTKLLTDRLLRLMLGGPGHPGADPRRIQCLTFTRAAAAEMSLRLQDRLGRWVTMDDPSLAQALAELGVATDEARLRRARALFATVLDLPGGMRIGTIHAFCQSLLRRFPLEAGISPHFQLIEDGEARQMLEEAREAVLATAPPASLAQIAEVQRAEDFGALIAALDARRDQMAWMLGRLPAERRNALRRALGVSAESEEALLLGAVSWPGETAMRQAVRLMLAHGSPAVKERGASMEAWLAAPPTERVRHWEWWQAALLTAEDKPRAASAFAGKPPRERHPEIIDEVEAEQARLAALLDARRAVRLVDVSAALLDLAVPILRHYAERKRERGFLDYADMIGHTAGLLRDPGAAWVLYKLDGGLDHLLLDEVQDTAPEQWQLAHVITEEFFAGLGQAAEARPRTFFAVGDPKQSIYSFQGADPEEFDRSHARMAQRVRDAGQQWKDVPLDVSFRSTAPVLDLVDAVFADPVAAHGVSAPGALHHYANRVGDAGRVEIWPLQPRPAARERAAWEVAERNEEQPTPQQALAVELAAWIKGQLSEGVLLPSQGRPLQPGDVLVLVRRRGTFAPALVRALKVAGVPVAGLDRLALREQLAVQDLLALCDVLLLPSDDLQLACVLTSPLGGLTDDSLMELALGRTGRLWDALRQRAPERRVWADALRFLDTLHARADFVTPHALLSEALGPLGGRARLLRRLGPEAAEPIDELLTAALSYVSAHPPSLQGFVHWMRASSEEVKREPEGPGGLVRVMTVHGAKGLQARLVILPDTSGDRVRGEPCVWLKRDGVRSDEHVPVWVPRAAMRSERVRLALDEEGDADRAERNRLLYVALTRAQDRLVVCGWEQAKPIAPDTWYAMVRRGFEHLNARVEPHTALTGDWTGERLALDSLQVAPVQAGAVPEQASGLPLPSWAGRAPAWRPTPLAAEPQPPRPLAPSRPDGVHLGTVPRTISPLVVTAGADPFKHGRLVHAMLQYLPDVPEEQRAGAARAYAARPGFGLSPGEVRRVVDDALGVIADPELAPLFGPGSRAEQPLVGVVGGVVVSGVADRVAVLPGEVLVADFKTDRDPPDRAEDAPRLYLGQLSAYQAVLAAAFPDRPIRCVLVWTRSGRVMGLSEALLAAHRPYAGDAA